MVAKPPASANAQTQAACNNAERAKAAEEFGRCETGDNLDALKHKRSPGALRAEIVAAVGLAVKASAVATLHDIGGPKLPL